VANAFFPEDKVSEVRDRSSILEVVSDYVKLKKAGKNYKGLCPFHTEKTPSFMVNEEKQIFHCFGCGEGGDVFSFLMKVAHFSFPQALEELARRYGVKLAPPTFSPTQKKEAARREALFHINQMAMEYFYDLLRGKAGERARRYLSQRGLQKDLWEEHQLGYSLESWNGLVQYLRDKKVDLELARELGLVLPRKREGWYDVFRGRIIFPIVDIHQRPVGFGGRVLNGGQPKYINSSESIIYHKGEILYGLHAARRAISEKDCVVIVEGYFDLLALHQNGFRHSVATSGTALTSQHIRTLKRYTPNAVTLFDADPAGMQANARCLPLFLEEGIWAKTVLLPEGEDPDTFLRKGDVEGFKRRLEEAVPLFDFFFENLTRAHDMRSMEGRVKVAEEGIALLRRVPEGIRRSFYVKALAEKVDIEEAVLHQMLRSPSKEPIQGKGESRMPAETRGFPKVEEMIVRLMALCPEMIPRISEEGILRDFEHPTLRRIAEHLEGLYRRKGTFDLAEASGGLEEDLQRSLRSICLHEDGLEDRHREKVLVDCVQKIHERRVRQYRGELLRRIKEAERRHGVKEVEALLQERQKLEESGPRKDAGKNG
jgi:DNA primase